MSDFDKKANFLALCLLETLEDENFNLAKTFIHNASPNTIILEKGFAPIHYAAGMENLEFAEKMMGIFLNRGGNPNIQSEDGITPLHIACECGRTNIVKMLLVYGGDINIMDNDRKTPFQYAVFECHFDVIQTIQNHIFEEKIEKKKLQLKSLASQQRTPSSSPSPYMNSPRPQNPNLLSIKNIDDNKFTPNRINYNFDVTSPYFINITHRRKSKKSIELPDQNHDDGIIGMDRDVETAPQNIFELTEDNLCEFTRDITVVHSRKSLINVWREKVGKPSRRTMIRHYNFLEEFLSECEEDRNSEDDLGVEQLPDAEVAGSHHTDSFVTADCGVVTNDPEINFIRSPKNETFIIQMTENYVHTDDENGIVFYEKKILPNPVVSTHDVDLNSSSHSTVSTVFTVPADYDTDALRQELTMFGEPPGPINKYTKRLYLKRLIKYKRDPNRAISTANEKNNQKQPNFSIELKRTLRADQNWHSELTNYIEMEKQMTEFFNQSQARKFREGHLKTSFVYLLIDPRTSNNLPGQHKLLKPEEVWSKFLQSIFYVGKGKSSRPYSHLYDAMKFYQEQPIIASNNNRANKLAIETSNIQQEKILFSTRTKMPKKTNQSKKELFGENLQTKKKILQDSQKLERIVDIWSAHKGVVCLHLFHNILPAEAYTREAAMIDCLTLNHLTNKKRGDYYGVTQSWNMRLRKQLGIGLLHRAMQIFLAEGESQLMPTDLV